MSLELKLTYDEMPKSKATSEGMKSIKGKKENIRARLSQDVVYKTEDGLDLKLRFIYPESLNEVEKYPLYVHVQGSAWFPQDLNNHILDFKGIVERGYMVAVVEYRPSLVAKIPSQVIDTKDALRYIAKNSDTLKVDIDNVFLGGDSSGGHTSTMCWATWNNGKLDKGEEGLPKINAFINLYGVSNLITMVDHTDVYDHDLNSPGALALGLERVSDYFDLAKKGSPVYYIDEDSNTDPLLIMHGNKDRLVPFEQSVELFDKCKEYNKNVEFYCVDDADHGGNVFYCKETIDIITGFLDKNKDRF